MKALVYHGPGARAWDSPRPRITVPTDIVMRVDAVTICGTDLHILKGDVPEVEPGTILGHEAVGTVVETGDAVTTLEEGDRVLASCITSCGRCPSCREGRYGLCTGGGGWILGHLIDGVQAEYARIPFADTSAYRIPAELTDEQVLFLADILPTSFEVGVLAGRLRPGDTVAIVGAGPIGLAAVLTANLYTPRQVIVLDPDRGRLDRALACGATDAVIETGEAASRPRPLADGWRRRRPRHRGGRRAGDIRALHRHRPGRRSRRERRRARQACDAPSGAALDQGRDDHDGARRHLHDAATDAADRGREARSGGLRDAPLLARRGDGAPTMPSRTRRASGAFKVVLEGEKHRQLVPAEATLVGAPTTGRAWIMTVTAERQRTRVPTSWPTIAHGSSSESTALPRASRRPGKAARLLVERR